ncbi:MAG: DUF4838 domain-containing protein [Armatimonadota bacterium]|nr:DUF4838 domain-containing protein [Armatimonadota bacterium]
MPFAIYDSAILKERSMYSSFRCKRFVGFIVLLAAASIAPSAFGAGRMPPLRRYRDLKVYTTSAPDKTRPGRILARTQFVNEGPRSLKLSARLNACRPIGFAGAGFARTVAPGKSVIWQWRFTAPTALKRQILTGSTSVNGRVERDLYIAVQGRDPVDMRADGLEKITEAGRVVATYAPRALSSIEAELAWRKANRPIPALMLASAGKTDYTIILESEPASKDEVIGDLQRVVKLQSGAEMPVKTKAEGPAIILRKADLGAAAKGLYDAYRLRTEGRNVIIESPTPLGLRNGIYGLLTDHLGCHWFQPNALGEEVPIPKDKTVRLPKLNEAHGSVWSSCSGVSWGRSPLWDARNRAVVNYGRMSFGHCWEGHIHPGIYPFDKFPEYYARDGKGNIRWKASSNFCSTNPDVIEIVAKNINNHFKSDPNAIVASLDPNDYSPMCLCDRCLALDKKYGQTREDGMQAADRLLHFSKEIHDRLEPQFKDKYLGILVYGLQIELPKTAKPHPRHAGIICDMMWVYDHSRPWNDPTSSLNHHFYELVKGWGKLLPQFGYYDYFGQVSYLGPWSMVHKMREDIPAFRDLGGTFLMLENQPLFITQGLNHYISGRLVWDVNVDVDLALEEFFREYYGPAAKEMREYWLMAERFYALERPSSNWYPRAGIRHEFWTELAGCLARAEKSVADLPASQKRFADRVKMVSDAFAYAQCRFEHDAKYGWIAQSLNRLIDHGAGIAYLRKHRIALEEPQKKYSGDDGYWPPLAPVYSVIDVDAAIKQHENPAPAGMPNYKAAEMPGYSDAETFTEMRKTMTEIFDFPKTGWKFAIDHRNKGISGKWYATGFNDSKWRSIQIAKFWEEQGVDYNGAAWYRKHFTAPAIEPGKKVFVVVGAADDWAKVWLNDQYLGEQNLPIGVGAGTPFALDVTKVIRPGKANLLAVRVDDPGALGGLWKSIKLMVK